MDSFESRGITAGFSNSGRIFFEAQQKLQASLESKVRREVEWLRRGAKARTTKSKARIDEANRLIGELGEVSGRARTAVAGIDFTVSDRRTKRLVEAEGPAFGTLFQNLDLTLMPGMRLGLVGANGSGKTTLLRVLTGALHPTAGTLKRADGLRIVYFDQHREQLNPDAPLRRALAEHGDSVIYRGRPQHVAGWAKRFLFRPEQLESPVGSLSGGERARVLIARLMLQEADLLLLDEPANDLDIPTLEVLEESLLEFPGAMVLVTHDRFLLDRVATVVLGLDGRGRGSPCRLRSVGEGAGRTAGESGKNGSSGSARKGAAEEATLVPGKPGVGQHRGKDRGGGGRARGAQGGASGSGCRGGWREARGGIPGHDRGPECRGHAL